MNVSAHLQNLGIPAIMISRVGKDELGAEIKAFMKAHHLDTRRVQTDPVHPTGMVKVTIAANNDATYEIVHPVAWDFINATPKLCELVGEAKAIVFGTLACRDTITRTSLTRLLEHAPLAIYDVNLRPPHYSKSVIESFLHLADIVKMNDDELKIINGWFGVATQSDEETLSYLKDKFALDALIVTQGGDGAMLLDETGFYKAYGYKVKVADTVGSGDAFLAGYLKNRFEGTPAQETLDYACALGAVVAMHRGANPPIQEKDVFAIMHNYIR